MSESGKELGKRIAEIRRRHFGPRGKSTLAEKLGLSPEDITRFERGSIPPGEIMVALCELTGEDLQWLLTGIASRGTVVISQARGRHQQLLARLASALEARPELAGPVESFIDLLLHEPETKLEALEEAAPAVRGLIPIFEPDSGPRQLPSRDDSAGAYELERFQQLSTPFTRTTGSLIEPHSEESLSRPVSMLTLPAEENSALNQCLESETLAAAFPGIFGLWIRDEAMLPTFEPGQAVLAVPGRPAQIGFPVVCAIGNETRMICRYWLGSDNDNNIQFGRLSDGGTESYSAQEVRWTAPVQFQFKRAA